MPGLDLASRRFLMLYSRSLFRLKYRYTRLGFAWNFLEPACYMAVLSVVFSVFNRLDIRDYAVFLFSALLPWRYVETAIQGATPSIVEGGWLLRKHPASPLVFPLARWLLHSFEFVCAFAVMLVACLLLKQGYSVHLLALPLSALVWAAAGLGVGLVAAVGFTFFRDIRPLMQMGLMLVFFTSPILFTPDVFEPTSLQAQLLRWHPMTYFTALFQKPIYLETWPSLADWGISGVASLALLGLGAGLMRRLRPRLYFYL